MRLLVKQGLRFGIVGGINTVATYLLFVLLQTWLAPRLAYTLVFAVGLTWMVAMTSRYVFSARASARRMAGFALWYVGVYLAGITVVRLFEDHTNAWLIALATIAVTAPLSFIGGRLLFYRRRTPSTKSW